MTTTTLAGHQPDAVSNQQDCTGCGTPLDPDGAACTGCRRCPICGSQRRRIQPGGSTDCDGCDWYCDQCEDWFAATDTCSCLICTFCSTRISDGDQYTIGRNTLCEDCTYYCNDCETRIPDGEYCECPTCDRCGDRVADNDSYWVDSRQLCDGCTWYCDNCETTVEDGDPCSCQRLNGLVHSWSYLPQLIFRGAGPLYLGMELEVAIPNELQHACAELAVDTLGDLGFLKEDGSVNGFELVTHPMTYTWAMSGFPWPLLPQLRTAGGSDTAPNTGLHVHLSRAGFAGPAHIHRWMKLIHRNRQHVLQLARRDNEKYAAFTDEERRAVVHYAKHNSVSGKYRAINTCPEDTFELRMFASSLQPEHVQAVLGFADASVEYTRTLTVADIARGNGWGWESFRSWVSEHDQYAPLAAELNQAVPACA